MTGTFHTITREEMLATQHSRHRGSHKPNAAERLERYGRNTLPESKAPGVAKVFLCQGEREI